MYNIYNNDKNKCLPITYEQYDTDATCITIINLLWITVLNRKKVMLLDMQGRNFY